MQLGIFAKIFPRPTLEETLDAVTAHGLHCVQFNMECSGLPPLPDEITADSIERIQAGMEARGIVIAAVSGTYNMIHPDPRERTAGLRRLRVLASACKGMGTSIITLCTGTRDPHDQWRWHPENASAQAWQDLLSAMESALQIAEETDVTLAFEPERANVVNSAAKGRALLDAMRSARLKVVIDGANIIDPQAPEKMHRTLDEAFELLGEHIVLAHAKDRASDDSFRAAGEGILDYAHYLRLLQSIKFRGPLILHSLAETQVDSAVAFLRSLFAHDFFSEEA
jgi:sugar phosphate isomerase/epimerase